MSKELSDRKCEEIALICYANVCSNFASFCNPKNRGPKFSWTEFADMMENYADSWMFVHHVKGDREQVNTLARKFAREIAEGMLRRAGL